MKRFRSLELPPYFPVVAEEVAKKLEEKLAAQKAAYKGKLLLDTEVQRKTPRPVDERGR